MKNFIIRVGVFLGVFSMCMSCVVFGGAELYTGDFGLGLAMSFIMSSIACAITDPAKNK